MGIWQGITRIFPPGRKCLPAAFLSANGGGRKKEGAKDVIRSSRSLHLPFQCIVG